MKTHVITVSTVFPVYHPKAGQPTNFVEKILSGEKIHTIRENYAYWQPKIDEVAAGKAVLSIRHWTGKPYKSVQKEILQLKSAGIELLNTLQVEKIQFGYAFTCDDRIEPAGNADHAALWVNDGLAEIDFYNWFKKPINNCGIIHFTDFRY